MTNISIEKKTLATATLISGVAGLNSANRCKPIVCRNINSRTLNMKRPKTLLLAWLLALLVPAAAWAQNPDCNAPITITADAPYTQGFESPEGTAWNETGPLPDCWDAYTTSDVVLPHNTTGNAFSGSQSLSFYVSFGQWIYVILPEFSNPIGELQVSFYLRSETASGSSFFSSCQLSLGYITAEDDGTCNTFTVIEDFSKSDSWVKHTKILYTVPATAERLVFMFFGLDLILHIDDLEVSLCECFPVDSLSVNDVTVNSASLSWELVDESQTEWNVQVATDANFTENLANYEADTHENFLIDGLSSSTTYYMRVKPACDEDLWSNAITFWTLDSCDGPVTVTPETPYTQGFESPIGSYYVNKPGPLPSCWEAYTTGTVPPHNTNSNYSHNSAQSLSFNYGGNYALLPEFSNPLNELQISFWMISVLYHNTPLVLGYITDNDDGTCNTFTAIAEYDYIVSVHEHVNYITYLPNVPDTARRLVFKSSDENNLCYIDDVEVSLAPDCYHVEALSLGEVYGTSAYLSWELIDNRQTAWDVQVATDAAFTDNVAEYVADSHEYYLLSGLSFGTNYYVRVKPTCSNDLWSNTVAFITLCEPDITFNSPYIQDFEGVQGTTQNYWVNGQVPACWEAYSAVSYAPHVVNNQGVYPTQTLAFYYNDNNYAALPEFSIPLNQLQIGFKMSTGRVANQNDYSGQLQLGYITAEDDGTYNTFTAIANYANYNYANLIERNTVLNSVPLEAQRLVFKWTATNIFCFIDDVTVSINPASVLPHDIAAVNITPHTADITWEGLCDSYALRYQQVSLAPEPLLNEGFEGGTMPQGWTIEGASQDPAKTWRVGVGDYSTGTGTHSGSYNALITHNTNNQVTYLVTPAIDLGGYGSAELSFWYVNRIWSGDIDEFAVCYRIGNESEWNELWSTAENHQAWTSQSVELTGLADNYQIGFRFTDHWGYGVGLDDIALNGVVLSEWITVSEAESPYTLTGLTPETTYEVQVQGTYGSSTLDWSESVTFTTLEACPVPFDVAASDIAPTEVAISWTGFSDSYNLSYRRVPSMGPETLLSQGFEGGTMPQGWIIEGASQDPAKTWRVGVGDYNTGTGTHSGSYNALITHNATNQVTYLVMPALDLGEYGSAELSFWYVNCIWSGDIDEFAVCYRIGNEGEWNELWSTAENHQAWTSQSVELTGLADNYQIGFRFTDHWGYGVGLDDIALSGVSSNPSWITLSEAESPQAIASLRPETEYEVKVQGVCDGIPTEWSHPVTFTTLEACPVPFDVEMSDITPTEATVSWTGFSDSYNLSYRRVPSTTPETILNEGFEGGTMPQGWTIEGASQDPAKTWRVGVGDHFSETGTHSGNYNALITHNARNQVTYLVMPALDLGEYGSAELSFWYINKRWGNDTDEFGVCYRIGNEGEWNELWNTTDYHYAWTSQSVALTGLADNYQIGFRFTDHYGYGVGLDDIALSGVSSNPSWITLSEAESPQAIASLRPETEYEVKVQGICDGIPTDWSQPIAFSTLACTVPGNLAVSDITATGATLTWTGTSVDYNVQLGVIAGSVAIVDEDFSEAIPASWDNDSNYPWAIVDGHMQSSNGSIHSTSSAISLTMTFPFGGTIEFDAECKGEGSSKIYDKCIFTIDGEQQFCYGANMPGWNHYSYDVDAGTHTFTWSYTKDGSVNPTGDYFAVDNVVVAVGECIWEEPLLANGESITLSALTPSTTYYAQVQGICDGISTDWSEIVTFTTLEQTAVTQTTTLTAGWNWWSTYLDITLDDLKAALVEALPGTNITITTQNGNSTSYNGTRWRGTLNWDANQMCIIHTAASAEITLQGMPTNPAENPIVIGQNYNWIVFPLSEETLFTTAFSGFPVVNDDVVISQNGNSATYNGTRWRGSLSTVNLKPGQGYIYKSASSEDRILIFSSGAK